MQIGRYSIPNTLHNALIAFYPLLLVIGVFFSIVLAESTKEHQRNTVYILNSKNIINKIFAYKGNLVWTILFAYVAIVEVYIHARNFEILPTTNIERNYGSSFDQRNVMVYSKQYIGKFLLKNFLLYLCFLVIDEIFIMTGGQCSSGNESTGLRSAEACRKTGGEWVGGFDISGHFCFLMNISMILFCELLLYYRYIKAHNLEGALTPWINRGMFCVMGTLGVWSMLLFITAVYYHTLLEKILGCIMGYTCFYVMYYVIPNNGILNRYLNE